MHVLHYDPVHATVPVELGLTAGLLHDGGEGGVVTRGACGGGEQGVITPIGAVLTAETGDTTRSPGHGDFFPFGHGVTTVFRGVS